MSIPLAAIRQVNRFLAFLLLLLFVIFLIHLETPDYLQCPSCPRINLTSRAHPFESPLNFSEDESTSVDDYSIWCLHMAHRLESERYFPISPTMTAPSVNSSRLLRLPYRYSLWKSSSSLPRRITPCEHSLTMRLLMIIERICRQHRITFFMSDGTLLGSLRHHDMIPWDDDLDLMVPLTEYQRFSDLIKAMNETLVQHRVLSSTHQKRDYLKIFFRNTKSAGGYSWNFPFVDIFFYEQNATHLWQMADPDTTKQIKHIFPLVMRPFGELWLPAPHNARESFAFDPFDWCKGHFWDHRKEGGQGEIWKECDNLRDIYPFTDKHNVTVGKEVLRINGTVIQTVVYK